jgi:transcriptional regulator with XRE-family HTH domain
VTNPDDQRVADRVRTELARQHLTGVAAARSLGMNQRAFSRRMRGQVSFRIPELMALAELLNVSVESLLSEDAA